MSARFCFSTLAVLTIAGTVSLSGCAYNPASTVVWEDSGMPRHTAASQSARWKYKFAYYPGMDVYFEPYTKTYYWFDGDFWYEGAELPKHISVDLGEPHFVRIADPKPYMNHATVVRGFAGWQTIKPGATDASFYGRTEPVGWEYTDWTETAWMQGDFANMCGGEQFMCSPDPAMCPNFMPGSARGNKANMAGASSVDGTANSNGDASNMQSGTGMSTMADPDHDK